MKKVGHTSEFPFGIYWWTLKNPKKSEFWENEKNYWRYHHFINVYQKPQSYEIQFLDPEIQSETVILDHFWLIAPPSISLNNPENQNFEKMKKTSRDVIILNLCNKFKWCMLTQTWSGTDIIFCHFRPFFALLPHYWSQKLKFGKKLKNKWRYYPFTHVHHKS